MRLAYWSAVTARGVVAVGLGLMVASGVGLAAGAALAEPSQIGAAATAAVVEQAKTPATASQSGTGQLRPDAGALDAADESPAASSSASAPEKLAPVVAAPPPPPPPSLLVDIDLTKQRMSVSEHGKVKHTWPISSGRDGYRTPTGSFRPAWMAKMC